MNILIVSNDSFFIAGTIRLIRAAWQRQPDRLPVFIISDEEKALLAPDVIISDIVKQDGSLHPVLTSAAPQSAAQTSPARYMTLFLNSQCKTVPRQTCAQHFMTVEKRRAAEKLDALFRCRASAIYSSRACNSTGVSGLEAIALSKQQAMVVKYTRQGLSLTDISRLTHLSVKTISTHKRAVMRKLGITNNSQFYQYALAGYIPH